MITCRFETDKLTDYFRALAAETSRELPIFVRGQAVALVNRIQKELKTTQKRIKSIRKIFSYAKKMKDGRGLRVHNKARDRAEEKLGTWFRETNRGRLILSYEGDVRAKRLNKQQLAVKYELGLRRMGVGSVRAGWIETLQQLDTRGGAPQATFSKTLTNPKSPQTWEAHITNEPYGFHALFAHDAYTYPVLHRAIQRGMDKTANEMERHLWKKTGEILEKYQ